MPKTASDKVLALAQKSGVLRARDLDEHNIPREYLARLVQRGLLEHQGRGLYTPASVSKSAHHTLVQVAVRVPDGVICLLSALAFHGITTQQPSVVWLALPRSARRPKLDYPPLRICHYSEPAFSAGVEAHRIEGRPVKIYSVAKTIADCFKYRNKIGLDVALEALQTAWRNKKVSMRDIEQHAAICRVSRVMQPYLEALVT
ncbi:MAG: type IV toxin-antitoxin system AbiEi family antitoxin domain-containing protein [Gammaproteobacteria bacterium]|nr:type IV toxin-antitoxin system AbiEi family antitoxin domain-containing protein [Gammaproteobacteria bacterium]